MIKKISIILYLSIFAFTGISVFLDISFWKDNTPILDFVPIIISNIFFILWFCSNLLSIFLAVFQYILELQGKEHSNILFGIAVLMICTLCSILKMGFSLYTYLWELSLTTSSFHVH